MKENFQKQYLLSAAQKLLQEANTKQQWDTTLQAKYESIDQKATQIMISAEKKTTCQDSKLYANGA